MPFAKETLLHRSSDFLLLEKFDTFNFFLQVTLDTITHDDGHRASGMLRAWKLLWM